MDKTEASSIEVARQQGLSALTQKEVDHLYSDLETQLLHAVADFSVEELDQMLKTAAMIRRARA